MRSLTITLLLVLAIGVQATVGKARQNSEPVPHRFQIMHSDPWMVKAMIEGAAVTAPELSSVANLLSGSLSGFGNQSGSNSLLQDGFLVVNPTDNSLWWYPKASRQK